MIFALIHSVPFLPNWAEGVNRQILSSFSRCSPTSGSRRRVSRRRAVAALAGGAQPRSQLDPDPPAKARRQAKPPSRPAKGRLSVGQHVFVIGHRVHIPTRFVGVGPCGTRRGQAGGRVVPGAEVPQDLLCNLRVINHRDDAHRALTDGAAQRVNMPDAQNQVAPALGGQFLRGRR